jgi:hypothetical protein
MRTVPAKVEAGISIHEILVTYSESGCVVRVRGAIRLNPQPALFDITLPGAEQLTAHADLLLDVVSRAVRDRNGKNNGRA